MPADLRKFLGNCTDEEYLQSFIDQARTSTTSDMNQTRVASEVLLAKTIKDQSEELTKTLIEQTHHLTTAINAHANALVQSGKAAERHAVGLKWATLGACLRHLSSRSRRSNRVMGC
jgi:hypothetical protein